MHQNLLFFFFLHVISSVSLWFQQLHRCPKPLEKMLEKYVPNECTLEAFPGIETDRFRHRMRFYCCQTLVLSVFETWFLSTTFCLNIHSLDFFLLIVALYYVVVTYNSNHKIFIEHCCTYIIGQKMINNYLNHLLHAKNDWISWL